jgi:hypothetical protein
MTARFSGINEIRAVIDRAYSASGNKSDFLCKALLSLFSYFGRIGAGRANRDAGIATFACISLNSVVPCPSVHVTIDLKGNFTPATSR